MLWLLILCFIGGILEGRGREEERAGCYVFSGRMG